MLNNNPKFEAIHIEDGNFFDNVRIDINKSHKRFDELPRKKQEYGRSYCNNRIRYYINGFLMKYRLQEFLVNNPGWPLQNPPPVATPKYPTCEGGHVGS